MIIHKGYDNLTLRSPVVTIGIFDGVHLGHKSLLGILVQKAFETNGESVVITFDPHPRMVLDSNPEALSFLTTYEEKIALLEKAGVDHLLILEFTHEFSHMKACDFVNDVLVAKIGTKTLIMGHDHRFGFRGEGNIGTILGCAEASGIKVVRVPGLFSGTTPISSSSVRNALLDGKPEIANDLLGYVYSVKSRVVEGKKLGRDIGFPTANIRPGDVQKLVPADGVYAVEVLIADKKMPGMLNIGTNPTVSEIPEKVIEVNIFDFDRNIYGEVIEVYFRFRLRDEIKFKTLDELIIQMQHDKERTLKLLS